MMPPKMNKIVIRNVLEYCSFSLVLSYNFIHNIYIVFIGIFIAIDLMNKNIITKIFDELFKDYKNRTRIKLNEQIRNENDQITPTSDINRLSLVDTIEELGFIPSIGKNNDSNAE